MKDPTHGLRKEFTFTLVKNGAENNSVPLIFLLDPTNRLGYYSLNYSAESNNQA